MTIQYSLETSNENLYSFYRLLLRWKGSVWQCIYKELLIWLIIYGIISAIYRYALTDDERLIFESVSLFCDKYSTYIPVTFMLGFYVNFVISRWWDYFMNIPWPDSVSLLIATNIQGSDEQTRILRRTIVRYLMICQVIMFRCISSAAKKRFPTLSHMVEAGLMTEEEMCMFEDVSLAHWKHWIPIRWINHLLLQARKDGKIDNDMIYKHIWEAVDRFRQLLGILACYDWVSIPLVYTQVVHIGVRSYFIICLVARQYLDNRAYSKPEVDIYVPIFTLLQFVFYVGWIKVAEVGINPLGEDDDDFEINYIIDRNLQTAYSIVDDRRDQIPRLEKDIYWDDRQPVIPYTEASAGLMDSPYISPCTEVAINQADTPMVSPKQLRQRPIARHNSLTDSFLSSRKCSSVDAHKQRKASSDQNLSTQNKLSTPAVKRQYSEGVSEYMKRKIKHSRLMRMFSVESCNEGINIEGRIPSHTSVSRQSSVSDGSVITEIDPASLDWAKRSSFARLSGHSEISGNILDYFVENEPNVLDIPVESQNAEYQPTLEAIPE